MELYDRRGKPIRHARDIRYDNLVSGLSATDLQAAIDELAAGSTSYTDEDAQDAVGNILANSATIEFTYDDSTPAITADLSSDVLNLLDLADSAVQPGDLAAVAFTGDYDDLSNTPSIPADLSGLTFVTVDDETSSAANSRQLAAGTNITFDTSTPGRLEISASGGGGGTVESVVAGLGILVDDDDAANPEVSVDLDEDYSWNGSHQFNTHVYVSAASGYRATRYNAVGGGSSTTDAFDIGVTGNTNAWIWNYANSPIGIATNNTQRMTIAANGAVRIHSDLMSASAPALRVGTTDSTSYASYMGSFVRAGEASLGLRNTVNAVEGYWGAGSSEVYIGAVTNTRVTVYTNNALRLEVDNVGRLSGRALHNNASLPTGTTNHYIASGTYTPTLTNVSNAGSLTAAVCQWVRVGNVVTVSGSATVTPSSAGVVRIGITLPIGSGLTASNQLAGTGCGEDGDIGRVYGDATNDRAEIRIGLAFASTVSFHFTYLIL